MVYHGTKAECADKIIKDNCMRKSRGERHWLGDGVYFYDEITYAIRWIRLQDKTENFLDNYSIISAELEVDEDRIFSFLKMEHKIIFNAILEECNKKMQQTGADSKVVDGVVLNIMFDKMKYGNEFDMVEALFIHEDKSMVPCKSRLFYTPELQICVKNVSIIKNIQRFKIENDEEFRNQLSVIDSYSSRNSGVLNTTNMKYKNNRKKMDYNV